MAKGQTRREGKPGEKHARGGRGKTHETKRTTRARGEIPGETTGRATRAVERAMERTRKATLEATRKGEQAVQRTGRAWEELLDVNQTVDLTRNWLSAAWNVWDASTAPLRSLYGVEAPPRQRR